MGRRWQDGRGTLVVPEARRGGGPGGAGGAGGSGRAGEPRGARVPLEIATSYRARTKGLLGRDSVDGAILLSPANSIHTFRMRIPIDVAYLDRDLNVIAVRTMKPWRLGLPRPRSRHVLEAEAGAMAGWGLRAGVRVEVRDVPARD
ncbi:DUF192 domain-containing protein [Streptomyces spinosirectus]|uniref:DUF192 domain-containing protein n=1 Tax=Streptomyces TaxID=1883 RepID=UPI000FFF5648|nr:MULTISPECIES: DUF192 domain-containing protein [Streptomyces]MBY8344793.1 DUF192 domain-containing protein [Streptomyces plumbidurans]UIR20197.1 DUF192 domain-containing protein [Streptomyces spinosirectus]